MAGIFRRILEFGGGKVDSATSTHTEEDNGVPTIPMRHVVEDPQKVFKPKINDTTASGMDTVSSLAIRRRYLKGRRNCPPLDFTHLSWIKNEEDLKLVRIVCNVASQCADNENATVKDIAVYDDTPDDERYKTTSGTECECMLYRVVVSMSGNVPVNKMALDTIETADPSRIESIGVATYIPTSDDGKETIIADDISTQIFIYIRSIEHQKVKQAIEESAMAESFRPRTRLYMKKRKMRET